jgi:hypothetical protein
VGLARIRIVLRRLGSIENRLDKIVYYTFGLIPAILISKTRPNSSTLLTLYSVSIAIQINIIFIYRIF